MESDSKVKHVVVDSGAFIRNADIRAIGEKIFSLPEVVQEIRDQATRQRLQVLPYEIIFRQPSPESVKYVTDFAKQTGDYRSLSAVDLKVMGLTYQLEKEFCGTDHIKAKPDRNKAQWKTTKSDLEKPTEIAGFYVGKKVTVGTCASAAGKATGTIDDKCLSSESDCATSTECIDNISTDEIQKDSEESTVPMSENVSKEIDISKVDNSSSSSQIVDQSVPQSGYIDKDGDMLPEELICEGSDEEGEIDEDSGNSSDDDEGWITPSNIHKIQQQSGVVMQKASVPVGCITTDFAMQNVLLQMGLNVISIDGMLIKKAKSYILRCFACMKITTDVTKVFCPHCGNKTLQRVSMTVNEDGSIVYFLSRRKPISTKGMKYSMPLPKGGKHANNPIITEDQPCPQQRLSRKARQKIDALDPDYVTGISPFSMNDINSRAANLGVHCNTRDRWNKRNPNEVKKYHGRRK
ncbi:hypothetical protein ScPMuIL_001036 [Solemya velum]